MVFYMKKQPDELLFVFDISVSLALSILESETGQAGIVNEMHLPLGIKKDASVDDFIKD